MSGTASVPTQFQAAVTATGLQLDNNFNTIVGYLNDPTNRMNYATDGGTTNTLVINPSPPVVGGYSAGLTITFRAAFTNTAAVVANVSGIGNSSVLDQQQRQLTVSAIIAGSVYQMAYNGTSAFNLLSPNNIIASQPVLTSLSGSGTYTVSAGATRIEVDVVGAGGGGAIASSPNGNAGNGGDTRFGILLAGGGLGGKTNAVSASPTGGNGGTATGAVVNMVGSAGNGGSTTTLSIGGSGGAGPFGGAGAGGSSGAGQTGGVNSGSGAGGGATDSSGNACGGGGAGAYAKHIFSSPAASYSYSVGIGGAGGSPGGATGAAGIILVKTFFA